MDELVDQLERRAERGEVRGARVVFRQAQEQSVSTPAGRRGRALVVAAAVTLLVGGLAFAALERDATEPEVRVVDRTADALASEGAGTAVIWTHGDAVFRGDPQTGEIRRLADLGHSCGTCPIVRAGGSLFIGDERGLQRLDGSDQPIDRVAGGDIVFPSADQDELFVATRSRTSPHGSDVELIDVDGLVIDGPWQVPEGYELTSPGLATTSGVVVQTPRRRFALWDPHAASIGRVFGNGGFVIDTFTQRGRSVVAWSGGDCTGEACRLFIRDVVSGTTLEIAAPDTVLGFIGGGGFSPDGSKLAVFGKLDRGDVGGDAGGRRMQLVIVDVASGQATAISRSEDEFGESYGFTTWSPSGQWLFFGGLRNMHVHRLGTRDAVTVPLPAQYSAIAVDESF